jgi:ketosteroid isomerase-like protein
MRAPLALLLGGALLAAAPAFAQDAAPEPRSLEQRAGALEDEAAIERLILDYGRHLDALDFASFAALFAEDAAYNGQTGPAAIEASMIATFGPDSGAVWTTDFHIVGNILVDLYPDGDEEAAAATARWVFVSPGPDNAPKPVLAGRYVDSFTRTPDGWRFASRQIINDMAMQGFPAVRAEWGAQ